MTDKDSELLTPIFHSGPSPGAAVVTPSATVPLAALLAGHVIHDGEEIILALRPSIWYMALSMLPFAAVVTTIMIASKVFDDAMPGPPRLYVATGSSVLAVRFMFSILQWMSRLYVLTDLRILRLSGIFAYSIFDCPLRKIARTRVLYTMRERCCRVGSIEIIPSDETLSIDIWQTVPRPCWVNEQINHAILRARRGMSDSL